jgi:ureidoacrylate peracid hydrolase
MDARATHADTAVIMIDMQNMYLEQEKRDRFGWPPIFRFDEVVAECAQLLDAARAQGLPIIYTRQVQRADGADMTPSMRKLRASVPEAEEDLVDTRPDGWAAEILDAVAPQPGDVVLDKLRWDAFFRTELDVILRNLAVRRLVIAGLQTNVCVETTSRSAMMMGFEVAVPEDAVSTDGESLHVNALDAMRVLYVEIAPWRELLEPGAEWNRALTTPSYGRVMPVAP